MRQYLAHTMICATLLVAGAGCTTYYQVTDPTTGKAYYSTDIKQDKGYTKLKDAKTGSEVTIQNSEVKKITQEEFESNRGK